MNKIAFLDGYMSKEARNVLLIHGWNRGPEVFDALSKSLKSQGHTVQALSYPSTKLSAAEIADKYITPFLKSNQGADVVTHSAGGMLTRLAAQKDPSLLTGRRTVMVAPALGGSILAIIQRILNKIPGLEKFKFKRFDPILTDLSPGSKTLKSIADPIPGQVGVIRGTGSPTSKKTLQQKIEGKILDLFGKHDGVVLTKHTDIPGAKSVAEVPYDHTPMLGEAEVIGKINDFLNKGRF